MNSLFHYHITGWLAREAGFSSKDALIIAQSATMVDMAVVEYQITLPRNQKTYKPAITHHLGLAGSYSPRDVWMPFHFIPSGIVGDELVVRPKSEPSKALLVAALKSADPYRIGIAMHGFADTWAHQNFIGCESPHNRLDPGSPLPPIGHAQAHRIPDISGLSWVDPRFPDIINDNGQRFFEAARFLFRYGAQSQGTDLNRWDRIAKTLADIILPATPWDLAKPYKDAMGTAERLGKDLASALFSKPETKSVEARITGIPDKDLLPIVAALSDFPPMDPGTWYQEALDDGSFQITKTMTNKAARLLMAAGQHLGRENDLGTAITLGGIDDFTSTALYKWSEAALAHRNMAHGLFASMSITV